jgi:hypothetical protein
MSQPATPCSSASRRRWSAAITGSGALHALLVLLLSAEERVLVVPAEPPVTIELIETPPATEPAPSRATGEAAMPATPDQRRARQRPETVAAPAPPDVAPATEPGSITLLPSPDQLARAGVPLAVAPAEAPASSGGPTRWQRGLADVQRRQAGRAAIAARKAPAEAFDLLRDMERIYAPSHELVLDLARKHGGRSRNVDRWLGRYLGGFLAKPEGPKDQPFDRTAAFMRGLEKATVEKAARVCATFRPGGEPAVEMDVPSGIRALDALAVQTVTRAAHRRVELVAKTRLCYLFSAKLTRIPPVPVLACGIGARGPECIYPLKEVASTKVTLDGVEPIAP